MELGYPENVKNSLYGIYYRFNEKFGYNNCSPPLLPFLFLFVFCPQTIAFHTYQPSKFTFVFHFRDNMMKINTFRMAVSKTYCVFHFKLKYVFFPYFFIWSMFGPKKMHFACDIFEYFSLELAYPENIKEHA